MVAFLFSLIVTLAGTGLILLYGRRRPVGTPVSWGEAMLGACYVFLLFVLAYGVVPDRWLIFAENEIGWTKDRFFFGWGDIVKPQSQGGWFPFDITYRVISDGIGALLYVVFLGGQIWAWAKWQNRDRDAKARKDAMESETSSYGRPLVRKV